MKYRDRIRKEEINRIQNKKTAISIWISILIIIGLCIILAWISSEQFRRGKSQLDIPDFDGSAYVVVNNNVPYFTYEDLTMGAYEQYSDLDSMGRCGVAVACLGRELMPTASRGEIGSIRPTGWEQAKYYGIVDANPPYLYNRCHLIAYCLTGENANAKNLITGTRYMNVYGMLPFEEKVADYLDYHDNHVLYRVTPVFEGDNLLASGVLMEAYSVEDKGKGISFCVFCYNVQPGIDINYKTGESRKAK